MKFRKPKLFLVCSLFLSIVSQAQFRLPVPSAFRSDIQKVVAEYPSQFSSIKGDVIEKNPQSIEYASLLKPADVQECSIMQYSSDDRPFYSWQATLLATEDFDEAAKKYKWLFNQLKGMQVPYVVDKYTLDGKFEAPTESSKFTSSVFSVAHPPAALRKLKVEASMQFEFPEWKVVVLIYEKEREDHEKIEDEKG